MTDVPLATRKNPRCVDNTFSVHEPLTQRSVHHGPVHPPVGNCEFRWRSPQPKILTRPVDDSVSVNRLNVSGNKRIDLGKSLVPDLTEKVERCICLDDFALHENIFGDN